MKKLFENKPRAWFILGSIFVFLITMFAVSYFGLGGGGLISKDVVAVVGGEKVRVTDFKKWLYGLDNQGSAENPSKWEEIKDDNQQKRYFIDLFVDSLVLQKEAKRQSITVTEAEIDARYAVPTSNYKNLTDSAKEVSREFTRAAILKEKLENKTYGWVAGDYILYRFDKYYEYNDADPIEGTGDQNKIQEQKDHAQAKANEAYQRLSSGATTILEENKTLEKDPLISYAAFAPYSPHISGETTKDEYLKNIGFFNPQQYLNFKESVRGLAKGKYTRPFVIKGNVSGTKQDVAYVIFHAKDGESGQYQDQKSWREVLYKDYAVEIYYKNLAITGVENAKFSLEQLMKSIIPTAYADCYVAPSALHGTEFLLATRVYIPDGVNYYLYVPAKFYLQAGTSAASPQLRVYGHGDANPCAYWGKVFGDIKYTAWQGYMYGGTAYESPSLGNQNAFLADCTSTSTAAVAAYKPTSTSWITNSGTLKKAYDNCAAYGRVCDSWRAGGGEGEEGFSQGINMAGFNGKTMHFEFEYRPHYNSAPTPVYVTPAAGVNFTANATGTTSINFTVRGNDVNGDMVQLAVAYCKIDPTSKACTSSWSYVHKGMSQGGPWSGSQPLTNQGVDTVMPPTEQLGVGDYKWVMQAIDEHGAIDTTFGDEAVIDCSVRSECIKWTHDIPRYFRINPATPVAALECDITPASGIAPLSVFATVSGYVTGSTFDYDFDYPSTTIVTAPPNPFEAMYVGRGPAVSFSYARQGNYNVAVRERFAAGGSREIVCGPTGIGVTSPDEGTGGEVAP